MALFRLSSRNGMVHRLSALLLIFSLAALIAGCLESSRFCCRGKHPLPHNDRTRPAATYCNDHSQAVNFYLSRLSSSSAKADWLDEFERFCQRISGCADPQCIAESVSVYFAAAEFDSIYESEHKHAEVSLSNQTAVSLSAAEKAELIRCGFTDAVSRARQNQQGE